MAEFSRFAPESATRPPIRLDANSILGSPIATAEGSEAERLLHFVWSFCDSPTLCASVATAVLSVAVLVLAIEASWGTAQ